MPMPMSRSDLPTYIDLMYPTLRAVATVGGSAQGKEVTAQVLDDLHAAISREDDGSLIQGSLPAGASDLR
jgi:hypothetical protein